MLPTFTQISNANRLVWHVDQMPTRPDINVDSVEKSETNEKKEARETFDPKKNTELTAKNNAQEKISQNDDLKELPKIEKKMDAAYESREIPSELQKMTRAEIRNLERKNPELLFKTCFWKIEEGGKLTPIGNSAELKAGDEIQFSVAEASGKNKNLEMGAGLRTLPEKFSVVQIGKEKFYRIYAGGPFVYAKGNYRAVRSHEKETIKLIENNSEDQKVIENISSQRGAEYAKRDVGFELENWLGERELTPETIDQFVSETKNNPQTSEIMKKVVMEHGESLKKFAEAWKGFNISSYKEQICNIESRGSGEYNADNHGVGASDSWKKRAIGRYQFTIETLNDMDVPIRDEADIVAFKKNYQLQEEIMDRFTQNHIDKIRDNPAVVEQIASGKYSIYQSLGAMHLGGAGALRKIEQGNLEGTDYMGTSFAKYMDKLEPSKAA